MSNHLSTQSMECLPLCYSDRTQEHSHMEGFAQCCGPTGDQRLRCPNSVLLWAAGRERFLRQRLYCLDLDQFGLASAVLGWQSA